MARDAKALAIPPPEEPAAGSGRSGDLITGSALIVTLIALFLPWYAQTRGIPVSAPAAAPQIGTLDGPATHGFLWLGLALAIVGIGLVVGRHAIARLPSNILAPGQLLIGTTGIAFLLCLLGVIGRPTAYTIPGANPGTPLDVADFNTVFAGWSYGGFVALAAAGVALLAAAASSRRLLSAAH